MNAPTISIFIPICNRKKYFVECIQSALDQLLRRLFRAALVFVRRCVFTKRYLCAPAFPFALALFAAFLAADQIYGNYFMLIECI